MSITDMRGLQYLGVAIHPTLNLINHDCTPNVVAVSCGPNIFVRAIRPIKAGDELFISYIDQSPTSTDRKQILKDQYYFDCTCKTCDEGKGDELRTAYILPPEDVTEKRSTYLEKHTDIMLKKIASSKKVAAWERVAAQAGGTLMQQESLFDDTHLKKLNILQTCAEVSAILNIYHDAATFSERVLTAFEKIYPENSTQVKLKDQNIFFNK
jgi:SET and MYND domain-containing protein